jgi:hypothetical protein
MPQQSVRSSTSSSKQCNPSCSRLFSVIILQDSNFRHRRFLHEFAIADIAASAIERQHVKLMIFRLTQPDTSWIIPILVTPSHLLNPISIKDLQLLLIVWKIVSEPRTPSIMMVFRFFNFCVHLTKLGETSCRQDRLNLVCFTWKDNHFQKSNRLLALTYWKAVTCINMQKITMSSNQGT